MRDLMKKFPELVLGAYRAATSAINPDEGSVLVWNRHAPSYPEYAFKAQVTRFLNIHIKSNVLTASFMEYAPQLIVGGTYSGQILLWDMRAKSMPVQCTPLSSTGHSHPIYSITTVGSQNAHNLMSASSDGLVCCWQLDMLSQPLETLELANPLDTKMDHLAVTCLGFPKNETSTFWVGTEEGTVYQANRFDRAARYHLNCILDTRQ